jgi:hypothetical protein
MKAIVLKTFVSGFGAFAAFYSYFLGSAFSDLFAPNASSCGTGAIWALQGGALFFAPIALIGSVGLWFTGRQRQTVGAGFSKATRVELVFLTLCVVANWGIFIPSIFE